MLKNLVFIFLIFSSFSVFAYELIIIQGISKEKQTFITRNTTKNKKVYETFEGKKVTFTSDNVSIIAKAINVSTEFTQWEIDNHFTDVPFQKGDIVTMYDATEYLWTLTPEKIKRRYVKSSYYKPRRSIEGHFSFVRGISESVTGTDPTNIDRGGFQFEAAFRKEFNINYSISYGVRYSKDIINIPEASIINTRFLGILEGRYYFDPMEDFHHAQIGLGLGIGFGQSRTETSGNVTFGNAVLLPATKITMMFPINKEYDFEFFSAFESLRLDESDANNLDQTTNLLNSKAGVLFRKHL